MEQLDITEIVKYLPHRYPFLLIDKVVEMEPGVGLTAIKNVTINEPIFTGHFPQFPVFPGVLILEAMAQSCAVFAFRELGGYPSEETLYLLVGIDKARFKRQVVPGDRLTLKVTVERTRRGIWRFAATGTVDGALCCTAEVLIAKNEIET
ncbi:3-hydroxyacyl-[acyl-carrier-protein] dehydratase FabZ [Chromatiales bacterium (ex Bugula neritina AB1)]|nr:3-hydroxyacyl-[acyl-carrier-protein] dehydratase FabZ [Chromatiales bacterium (ex Bugula neritina AB1)]